jgi:entry exclusion lipoprotein TrbK
MKSERLTQLFVAAGLMFAMLSGCDQFAPEKREKIGNPNCEDLGKITDDAEHAALLAKCHGYMRGGLRKVRQESGSNMNSSVNLEVVPIV